ncbi:hypothetical protein [Streptomyces kanamyceticus]|uniref:C2H2-type domain-containing protein n=1 Tax=Streptomyces kanamyceticus TaxID=1967 RepID=A0A5J6GLB3_STRKN|nr:hypothetical protein [Streptomyces kanamyceticus]QEU93826.1 hypothetical protein CP970_25595 [Streptomyces kanamyceticus]
MSEIADTGHHTTALNVVHESYAFACMRCGHGWEQSYEIEHHIDAKGQEFVTYLADGQRVPSPLTRPTCLNCGGHVVRIMRAGQVSSVLSLMHRHHKPGDPGAEGAEECEAKARASMERERARKEHHWHLSDLLHPFQHRKGA